MAVTPAPRPRICPNNSKIKFSGALQYTRSYWFPNYVYTILLEWDKNV